MSKILVLFDSDTHRNETLAEISELVLKDLMIDVKIRRVASIEIKTDATEEHYKSSVDIVSREDLLWADAYIYTFPIHTGTMSASMKYFFDMYHETAMTGVFINKPVTVMSVGKIVHAGAETSIQQMYSMLMQWGNLIVPTSIVDEELIKLNGNPYGLSFILDERNSFGDESILKKTLGIQFNKLIHIVQLVNQDQKINSNSEHKVYTIADSLNK